MMKKPIKTTMPKAVEDSKKAMKPLITKVSTRTSTGNGKRIVN
jgi:hypothetical protein